MKFRYLFVAIFLMVLVAPLAAQPVEGPNGNYYEYVSTPAIWADAKTAAEGMSYGGAMGYLATATSAEENNFMATLGASTSAYFGGFQPPGTTEPPFDQDWEWVSGEAWSFTAWGGVEPNDSGGEDCIHYRNDGLWNDISCAGARPYVVEYDAADIVPQSNTFPTSDIVMGGGDAGTPDMTITCNGGLPLTQTAPVGTTFTVNELSAGDMCTVALASEVDTGYEAIGYSCGNGGTELPDMAGCSYTMGVASDVWSTVAEIAASPVEFSVTVDWDISEDADEGVGVGAMVEVMCMDYYGYTSTTMPAGPNALVMPVTISGLVPEEDDSSYCVATLTNAGSAVDSDSPCGEDLVIGEDASCTITATAFYEGIPTLSQYGMAIMALLMLGLGFAGFRRFI